MNKDYNANDIHRDIMQALHQLNAEYVCLLHRLGCKTVTLHRI